MIEGISDEVVRHKYEAAALKKTQPADGSFVSSYLSTSSITPVIIYKSSGIGIFRFKYTFSTSGYSLGEITIQVSKNSDMSDPTEPMTANGGGMVQNQLIQSGDGSIEADILVYGDMGSNADQTMYLQATVSIDQSGTFSYKRLL